MTSVREMRFEILDYDMFIVTDEDNNNNDNGKQRAETIKKLFKGVN